MVCLRGEACMCFGQVSVGYRGCEMTGRPRRQSEICRDGDVCLLLCRGCVALKRVLGKVKGENDDTV